MIIGLDLDGTIADFNTPFVGLLKKEYPNVDFNKQEHYDYSKSFDISHNNIIDLMDKLTLKFFYELKPYEPVIQNIDKHIVYIITGRLLPMGVSKNDMLTLIGWWIQTRTYLQPMGIIMTDNKDSMCRHLGVDYFIDDNPEEIENIGFNTEPILIERNYNKNTAIKNTITSISKFIETLP